MDDTSSSTQDTFAVLIGHACLGAKAEGANRDEIIKVLKNAIVFLKQLPPPVGDPRKPN